MADPVSGGYVNRELNLKYGATEVDGKKWITRTPQIGPNEFKLRCIQPDLGGTEELMF